MQFAEAAAINTFSDLDGSVGLLSTTDDYPSTSTVSVGQTFTALDVGVSTFSFAIYEGNAEVFDLQAFVMGWDSVTSKATGSILYASPVTSNTSGVAFSGDAIEENNSLSIWDKLTFSVGAASDAWDSLTIGEEYVIFLSTFPGDGEETPLAQSSIGGDSSSPTDPGDLVQMSAPSDAASDDQVTFFTQEWQVFDSGFDLSVEINFIPEPGTVTAMLGLAGLSLMRRQRNCK